MNKQQILQLANKKGKPMIVEFWAPWCMPCKVMAPALEKTAKHFSESVELLRINADENPQALKDFGILGIPSMVVISDGKEISRHTGALDARQLNILFQSTGNHELAIIPPSTPQRVLRIGSGLIVGVFGYLWGPALPLYLIGGALAFSGVYDRCPVFKMLYPKIKGLFTRNIAPITHQ